MNIQEQNFQKRLVILPLIATVFVTFVAVMLTHGSTLFLLSSELEIDSITASDETKNILEILSENASNTGIKWMIVGGILTLPIFLIMFKIARDKVKPMKNRLDNRRILVDEMYNGKEIELKKKGYDAYSVTKLRLDGKALSSDYSVLNYVKEHDMILITEDNENDAGCKENNLDCIKLGQNPSIDDILKELEKII